jgi:hypothetical protein
VFVSPNALWVRGTREGAASDTHFTRRETTKQKKECIAYCSTLLQKSLSMQIGFKVILSFVPRKLMLLEINIMDKQTAKKARMTSISRL